MRHFVPSFAFVVPPQDVIGHYGPEETGPVIGDGSNVNKNATPWEHLSFLRKSGNPEPQLGNEVGSE